MPLVINSLGGGHTYIRTHTQTHTHTDVHTETSLRNQACAAGRSPKLYHQENNKNIVSQTIYT